MRKKDFLKDLNLHLKGLDENERTRVLEYYNEYLKDLGIEENDELDDKMYNPRNIAKEIIEDEKKGLERKIEEFTYSDEDIKRIELEIINPKRSIGEELYKVKDDKELRGKAIERISNVGLRENEKIIIKGIITPGGSEPIYGPPTFVVYQGLVLTSERLYIYQMDLHYKEIVEPIEIEIDDIEAINNEFPFSGIGIQLKNRDIKYLRSKYKNETELIFIIAKYLTESGVKFKYNKSIGISYYKYSIFIVTIISILMIIYLMSFIIK